MPRKARIDAPGALHHIIARGIERRKIFIDDTDRINFLDRLRKVLSETSTKCFAWELIPNLSPSAPYRRLPNFHCHAPSSDRLCNKL